MSQKVHGGTHTYGHLVGILMFVRNYITARNLGVDHAMDGFLVIFMEQIVGALSGRSLGFVD